MRARLTSPVFLLGVVAFLLSGMPKVRYVMIGVPIYLVDVVIVALALSTYKMARPRVPGRAETLTQIVGVYFFFVVLGELRGAIVYDRPKESLYMLVRFGLACWLPFIVPKILRSPRELVVVVKGLCVGLVLSALLSILYSLPFTRGIVGYVFSIESLNPVDKSALVEAGGTLRGETLIGTSTFSSGLMAMLWPLLYMGRSLLNRSFRWSTGVKVALTLLPLGILATYGRSAWLSVALVFLSIMLWGSGRSRAEITFWSIAVILLTIQIGIDSNLLMIDRIIAKTQKTLEAPLKDEGERERFMAYVEPFKHVVNYPSFLVAGTGAANRRWGGNAYGEAGAASHAIPGIAYYAYGVGGALCQILLMVTAFRLIYTRLTRARRVLPPMVWMWRALLAAWFGLLPWFLFAHGLVTQPRGAMAYFLFMGIILACEHIYVREEAMVRGMGMPNGPMANTRGPGMAIRP